jgi:hypothetical protein
MVYHAHPSGGMRPTECRAIIFHGHCYRLDRDVNLVQNPARPRNNDYHHFMDQVVGQYRAAHVHARAFAHTGTTSA